MKNKLTICGFIVVISLTVLVTIASASNAESLSAYVAQFSVVVNGEERDFENPIVTINDRTYIPLREVGELFGMDVEWDGENQKIIINNSQNFSSHSNETEWDTLYAFEQDELWGYEDAFGNVIIEPQFRFANRFSEGLAFIVDNEEQRGYIDLSGNLVIPLPTARFPREFSQGFARVILRDWDFGNEFVYSHGGEGGPFVFIDRTGKNVFGMEFDYARCFEEDGRARVIMIDGTRARIDRQGNIVDTSNWQLEVRY
jgi:hypothetical protein